MFPALNIDGLNTFPFGTKKAAAGWSWIDGKGNALNISDGMNYIVLREGIDGFSNSTANYATAQNANLMSEVLRQTNVRQREFGFNVAILGANHAEIERKRKTLLQHLSPNNGEGKLVKTFDTGKSVSISCTISTGYPAIPNGLPPNHQAKSQIAEVRFTAPDPYFYGDTVREYANPDGKITVNNEGDAVAPCRYRLSAETCRNTTIGSQMSAREGKTVIGVTVDLSDRRVSAYDRDGENRLGNFTHDSEFWMLSSGWNEIEGAEFIEFRPRWSCI